MAKTNIFRYMKLETMNPIINLHNLKKRITSGSFFLRRKKDGPNSCYLVSWIFVLIRSERMRAKPLHSISEYLFRNSTITTTAQPCCWVRFFFIQENRMIIILSRVYLDVNVGAVICFFRHEAMIRGFSLILLLSLTYLNHWNDETKKKP